jgi:hypothetical protein
MLYRNRFKSYTYYKVITKRSKVMDCKSIELFFIGSNPIYLKKQVVVEFGNTLILGIRDCEFKSHQLESFFGGIGRHNKFRIYF